MRGATSERAETGLRLKLNTDPVRLRGVFQKFGRIHLPDVLETQAAERLLRALQTAAPPWTRSVNVRGKPYDIPLETLAQFPPDRAAELREAVEAGGRSGFQYQFDTWRLSDQIEAGERRGGDLAPLEAVYDLLNGADFLGFVRELAAERRATYVDAQVTRYRAGDFLTGHDDEADGKDRLLAYVLNLTPAWRTEWGGLLLFHDADGHVAEGYTPSFNALNLFAVPQLHSVSQVASFVTASRYSITGWIRSRR